MNQGDERIRVRLPDRAVVVGRAPETPADCETFVPKAPALKCRATKNNVRWDYDETPVILGEIVHWINPGRASAR